MAGDPVDSRTAADGRSALRHACSADGDDDEVGPWMSTLDTVLSVVFCCFCHLDWLSVDLFRQKKKWDKEGGGQGGREAGRRLYSDKRMNDGRDAAVLSSGLG